MTRWLCEMQEKNTLMVYKQYKQTIKEESIYYNTFKSVLLYRARTSTLQLKWRNKYTGEEVSCELCEIGDEESFKRFYEEVHHICRNKETVWNTKLAAK